MFTDDLKVWKRIITVEDSEILREDLNALGDWSQRWIPRFKWCMLDI